MTSQGHQRNTRERQPGLGGAEVEEGDRQGHGGRASAGVGGTLNNRGLLRAVLLLFGLFMAWRFLAAIATIMLLLLTGLLLSVALSGLVEALHRRKVPRPWGTGLTVAGLLIPLSLGIYILYPMLAEQASQLASTLPQTLARLDSRLGSSIATGGRLSSYTPDDLGRVLLGGALGMFGALGSTLLGLLLAAFVSVYLVASPKPIVRWVLRLLPPEDRDESRRILSEIRSSLLDWLVGKLISMSIIGLLSTGALYVIGIPGALFLGIFAGLVAFVPLVGPIVSVVPPLLLALAGDPLDALWVVLAYVAIQQIESNLIMPLVMQRVVSVHPAVIIAAVAMLGGAFGLLGALLALPITLTSRVLIEELWFPRLEEGSRDAEPRGSSGKI